MNFLRSGVKEMDDSKVKLREPLIVHNKDHQDYPEIIIVDDDKKQIFRYVLMEKRPK